MEMAIADDLMNSVEAAEALGITRLRVWQLVKLGRIKAETIGRTMLFERTEIARFKKIPRKVGRPSSKVVAKRSAKKKK
jgi:excisionase family DNA binding protein